MKTKRLLPGIILVALWVLFAAYVWSSAAQLPERVATHFGGSGQANGWMTRTQHVYFTLAAGLGVPAFILGVFAIIRHCGGTGLNIPRKEYWLAPERREQTFAFIQQQGFWLAAVLIAFFAAMHRTILLANLKLPPKLTSADLSGVNGAMIAAIVVWMAVFLGRFLRKPR